MAKTGSTYSVLSPGCPSRLVLDRIADKWTALIVQILASGTMRHSELKRQIGDISQKMLTQTLRSLERDGLVTRTYYAEVPPRVEYEITELGASLGPLFAHLATWADTNLAAVEQARNAYDTR